MTEVKLSHPLKLSGTVQPYSWGKKADSAIPRLSEFRFQGKPMAELWLGAHPSGPSEVQLNSESVRLPDLIKSHPVELLGEKVSKTYHAMLPFLFKVLSIDQPLSIQTHPDAKLAQALHTKDPSHYPDPFPKPEVGMPLTKVEILYGFREANALAADCRRLPTLGRICGNLDSREQIMSRILNMGDQELAASISALRKEVRDTENDRWFKQAQQIFGEKDPGLFCFYTLNLYQVTPGQVIYIPPNVPHAYLSGDLLEVMAPSDNVIRAGLTPKYKDVETLLRSVDLTQSELCKLDKVSSSEFDWFYPPINAYFKVGVLSRSVNNIECNTDGSVELIFQVEGSGKIGHCDFSADLKPGSCFLIPAATKQYSVSLDSGKMVRVAVPSER